MEISKIKSLIEAGEIITPFSMSQALREPEPTCRAKIKDWNKVYVERQCFYVKDATVAGELQNMITNGELTNATKLKYDTGSYRKAVMVELGENYEEFNVGKRAFYVKKEGK